MMFSRKSSTSKTIDSAPPLGAPKGPPVPTGSPDCTSSTLRWGSFCSPLMGGEADWGSDEDLGELTFVVGGVDRGSPSPPREAGDLDPEAEAGRLDSEHKWEMGEKIRKFEKIRIFFF